MLLLQLLASGLQTGTLYGLTAAGFALIFGATRIFHVAHGGTFVIAGYTFYECLQAGLPGPVALGLALVAAVLFGVGMALFIYRPIQRHEGSFFTVFVAAFGTSIAVQSAIQFFFGRGTVSVSWPLTRASEVLPGLYLAPVLGWAVGGSLALLLLFTVLLEHTRMGLGLRALSQNPALLRAFGLSDQRLSVLAFALGSALVVPAAALTLATTGLQPASGSRVMLISLAATVVGGIGSLRGAALAGLLLGLVENLVVAFFDTQWSEAAGFVVLFAFILFRPGGLFKEGSAR